MSTCHKCSQHVQLFQIETLAFFIFKLDAEAKFAEGTLSTPNYIVDSFETVGRLKKRYFVKVF